MKKLLALLLIFQINSCGSTVKSESAGEYIDSSAITTKVKASFTKDKLVSVLDINVNTFKDVVQLSGFVDSKEQKEKAFDLAKNVNGVKKVINNIQVKEDL